MLNTDTTRARANIHNTYIYIYIHIIIKTYYVVHIQPVSVNATPQNMSKWTSGTTTQRSCRIDGIFPLKSPWFLCRLETICAWYLVNRPTFVVNTSSFQGFRIFHAGNGGELDVGNKHLQNNQDMERHKLHDARQRNHLHRGRLANMYIYSYIWLPSTCNYSTTQIFATSDGSRIKWYLKPNSK